MPLPPDRALATLTDVPRIAPWVPGVEVAAVNDDGSYDGTASVRLGPVALSFAGKARILEIDEASRTVKVAAEGADSKGRGRAGADVTFRIEPEGEASRVRVATDLSLTGTVAQYGRAQGLITAVANQIIGEFVANMEAALAEDGAGATAGGPSRQGPATGAAAAGPAPGAASGAKADGGKKEISGLRVLWQALIAWIRGPARR